jgi:hypothetical protein
VKFFLLPPVTCVALPPCIRRNPVAPATARPTSTLFQTLRVDAIHGSDYLVHDFIRSPTLSLWITWLLVTCRIAVSTLPSLMLRHWCCIGVDFSGLYVHTPCSTKYFETPIQLQWKSVNGNYQLYGVLVYRHHLYTTIKPWTNGGALSGFVLLWWWNIKGLISVGARSKEWVCVFESRRGHWCLSFVSVVCCQVEVSATGRSLVLRSLT